MIESRVGSTMFDAYVIEVQGIEAGIIVREPRDKHQHEENFKFLSASRMFNGLEGQEFASPYQAERAARKLLREAPRASNGEPSRRRPTPASSAPAARPSAHAPSKTGGRRRPDFSPKDKRCNRDRRLASQMDLGNKGGPVT